MFASFLNHRNMQEYHQSWCRIALYILIGTAIGILFAASAAEQYISLMRKATQCPVSIVGSAVAVFLPFLIFGFLCVHSKPWLVCIICAIYIGSLAASGWALHRAFGSGAWLVRLLMQFPQFVSVTGMVYLSARKLSGRFRWINIVYMAAILAILGMIDYCVMSPFLAKQIDSFETMERYAIHVGLDRCL